MFSWVEATAEEELCHGLEYSLQTDAQKHFILHFHLLFSSVVILTKHSDTKHCIQTSKILPKKGLLTEGENQRSLHFSLK